jgi:aryl-alcohol dehydrogenase-like predicted oxidoreductase
MTTSSSPSPSIARSTAGLGPALSDLSPFIYGTTRLGDATSAFDERVRVARAAMDHGVWFHTSHQYGDALSVLRAAFDQDRAHVPRLIFKIGWNSVAEVRATVDELTSVLGIEHMDIGQLCLNGELAEDFARGGSSVRQLDDLRREGRVGRYVLQVFPWTSHVALAALRGGFARGLIDGYIFYLNPLQRFADNALWDLLRETGSPIIAMRTVAGGNVHELRDVPGAAWKDYLRVRAGEVAPLFERSEVGGWPEFCLRFVHGLPGVCASVGSTSRPDRLAELVRIASGALEPLDAGISAELEKLQRRWSDELDVHGTPGSM